MSKKCNITNVKPMTGNNVSHAVNKTKRRFLPNLQTSSFFSEILGKNIRLKVTSKGIKTVEKNGGIDNYLLNLKNSKLTENSKKLKKNFTPEKKQVIYFLSFSIKAKLSIITSPRFLASSITNAFL